VSSDGNLTLRLLRELRAGQDDLRAGQDKINERLDGVVDRLDELHHTVGGMAAHVFAILARLGDHDRRIRKLESRPTK